MDYNTKLSSNQPFVFPKIEVADKICHKSETPIEANVQNSGMHHFFQEVEEVRKSINDLQKEKKSFGYMYSRYLSKQPTDDNMKESIMNLISSIKKTIQYATSKLKEMEETNIQSNIGSMSTTKFRIRKIQCLTLYQSLINTIVTYCHTQQKYLDLCKFKMLEQLEIAGKKMTIQELEEALKQGKLPLLKHGMIMDIEQNLMSLAIVEERHADIIRLKLTIADTSEMLTETLKLIDTDLDVADTVAYQVSKQIEYCEDYQEQDNVSKTPMTAASNYKSKSRRQNVSVCCCVSAVSVIIVGAVVLNLILFKHIVLRTPLL